MPPFGLQRLLAAPLLLLVASLASADAITGRVVDANGVGVAGVDIDFVNLGSGGNPHEMNDGTDVNGFFTTTVDPGVYEIRFFPPAPPASTLLTGVLPSVVVTGTKPLGTITLVAGFSVQGTVKNTLNQPVAGVKVDVFREDTGARVLMKNNVSSAFGTFSLVVPKNVPLRSQYLTSNVLGQVLAPREVLGAVPGNVNVGTITLLNGFHVTGTMRTQSGFAVVGANMDARVHATGEKLFTPGDNSNTAGVWDVVLPAGGTYDVTVDRPATQVLVGVKVNNVTINAATDLGVLTMRDGVFLSGTVRYRDGQVVVGGDVNVIEVATGISLHLGQDNTNAAGFYSVVVPTGLMDLVFSPPGVHTAYNRRFIDGVLISTGTTLDAVLPGAPSTFSFTNKTPNPPSPPPIILPLGSGIQGPTVGTPFLQGKRVRGGTSLSLVGGRPGTIAHLVLGSAERARAENPNVHLVETAVRIPLRVDASGVASFTLPDAARSDVAGPIFAQLQVRDAAAPGGRAVSHVLALAQ